MATHSSVLAWRIPGTREPGGLSSMGSQSQTRLKWLSSSSSSSLYFMKLNCNCIVSMCAQSPQSSPTLCNSVDCSSPGSSVHGILQARILKWVAIPFSRWSYRPRDQTRVSCTAGGFFTTEPSGKPYLHCSNLRSGNLHTGVCVCVCVGGGRWAVEEGSRRQYCWFERWKRGHEPRNAVEL